MKTLTHVHRDILGDPSEVLSFQKSLRRALKALFKEAEGPELIDKGAEKWVVSDRVGGHAFGSAWLFGSGVPGSLEFVGDECQASCSKNLQDTSGVLEPLLA
jgi:hypothetical protein